MADDNRRVIIAVAKIISIIYILLFTDILIGSQVYFLVLDK
jgi:hypothetical protein